MIKIGQLFRHTDTTEVYILAQVDADKCALIGINGGNRWNNPTNVMHIFQISENEFEQITEGEQFELVNGSLTVQSI